MQHYLHCCIIIFLLLCIHKLSYTSYTITIDDVDLDSSTGTISDYTNTTETDIIIPASFDIDVTDVAVVEIASKAFYSITLPESITSIGNGAFAGSSLTSVDIPSIVTVIKSNTFEDCALTSVTLPEGLLEIDSWAFAKNQLSSLNIPSTVTSISGGAFNQNNITEINGNSSNGIIYARLPDTSDDSTHIVSYGGINTTIDFIPEKVPYLSASSFSYGSITNGTIPENVVYIRRGSFYTYDLSYITIPTNPTYNSYGWSNENDVEYSGGDEISASGLHTYALINIYTISYALYGGTNSSNNPNIYDTTTGIASFTYPTKEVYSFIGWYNEDDDTKVEEIEAGTANYLSLYAKWDKAHVITSEAPSTATEDEEYSYTVIANDEDGDDLNYSLTDAPSGMSIENNVITWTPEGSQISTYQVTVSISDGYVETTQTFSVEVSLSTAIGSTETESLKIYPNPANSILSFSDSEIINSIELLTINGYLLTRVWLII